MSCSNKKPAFTLVEILVVLVIISIMSGLLITVVDPIRQRNRARDGTIVSSFNKVVISLNAYDSAYGGFPSCTVLTTGEIQNVASQNCVTGSGGTAGSFTLNSVTTPTGDPLGCDSDLITTGTGDCAFIYETTGTAACLAVRLHLDADLNDDGTESRVLIWTNTSGVVADGVETDCTGLVT